MSEHSLSLPPAELERINEYDDQIINRNEVLSRVEYLRREARAMRCYMVFPELEDLEQKAAHYRSEKGFEKLLKQADQMVTRLARIQR